MIVNYKHIVLFDLLFKMNWNLDFEYFKNLFVSKNLRAEFVFSMSTRHQNDIHSTFCFGINFWEKKITVLKFYLFSNINVNKLPPAGTWWRVFINVSHWQRNTRTKNSVFGGKFCTPETGPKRSETSKADDFLPKSFESPQPRL